jgi:C4-dicarboxylate transporter/malic acid transport protein
MTQILPGVAAREVGDGAESRGRLMIRHFAPAWFASVMGTGVLAVGCANFGRHLSVLPEVGYVLHWFNVALFAVLIVPWSLRWVKYRSLAVTDLRNPVVTQFYPTVGVGLLVLGLQFVVYGAHWEVATVLWGAGVILTLFFCILAPWILFQHESISWDHVTPGMFIPPVALTVIPLAGGAITQHAAGLTQEWLLLLNYASLGAGFFLYVAVLALTYQRFVMGKLLPGQLVPTVWINLGPIGATATSIIAMADASPFVADKGVFYTLAFLLWGFGAWWLAMAAVLTLGRLWRNDLPFSLTWWAFTFPLGAYAGAGARLGDLLHLQSVWLLGLTAFALLWVLWSATLVNTIKGVASGSLFRPHPAPAPAH